jgi:hypothetical protein
MLNWSGHWKRWRNVVYVLSALLIYPVSFVWEVEVFVNGPEVRKYLVFNAMAVCVCSAVLLLLLRMRSKFYSLLRFRSWFVIWLIIGLCSALALFIGERVINLTFSEPFLFTLWPSSLVLLIPGPWDWFSVVLVAASLLTNAALYTAWSSLVWWLARLLRYGNPTQVPQSTP